MKNLFLLLILLPTTLIASEKELECEMALTALINSRAQEKIRSQAESIYTELQEYDDEDIWAENPLKTLIKKEREELLKCIKNQGEDNCTNKMKKFQDKYQKLKEMASMGNIDLKVCENSELTDDLHAEMLYQLKKIKECKISHNHKNFIAEAYGISKKHIKTKNEIKIEIKDLYRIKSEHKLCNPIPIVSKRNISSEQPAKEMCRKLVKKTNSIMKLTKKCEK